MRLNTVGALLSIASFLIALTLCSAAPSWAAVADSPSATAEPSATADDESNAEVPASAEKAEASAAASSASSPKPDAKPAVTPKKVRYAQFVLKGAFPESPGGSGPFSELSVTLRKLIVRMDDAATDKTIDGVALELRDATLGRGQVNELRQAIGRIRAAGKPVVAEMEVGSSATYLIASACDEIVMPESGFLVMPGIRAEPLFYKGLLAKIGVKADFVHVGEAKGAAEPYTRRKWSEPVKENLTSMIDDLYEQMIDTIAMDRPMTRAAVIAAIDRGLLTATQAKDAQLIDRLAYADSLRETLAARHDKANVVFVENYGKQKVDTDFSGPTGFFKLMGFMASGSQKRGPRGQKVAIVYATGPIMTGESKVDPFGESESVGSTTVVEALDEAARDKRTVAIVLRVNSPGGSAVASDLIWQKIQTIDKPVIASMGDVAASGGYYISMGCDHVLAEPTTVTGSIGVVGGKMAVSGMLDKLGVTSDLIARGANSGIFSPMEKFSESERAALVELMDDTYSQFVAKAAAGRHMEETRVRKLGGGRVYTGKQAAELRLIDGLGDLAAAVREAKLRAGLDADAEVRIETYPEPTDFFESLFGNNDAEREVSLGVRQALSLGGLVPELGEAVQRAGWLRQVFAHEPVALLAPFELRIE
ncbi:signal peptide peptidase SppA [Botrimarina hoheduenensis]|uniref:Protease 4 n=1 Tax=Botrimarina hoheduenensis TaxID=2528000 RepID=A0A5C5WCB6_9BACT|nr:signal peptide peptidase SppA [Botrimarina hoheduenensis]TWT47312.1 Protease 4 [Botrimarina hoheduenensis]